MSKTKIKVFVVEDMAIIRSTLIDMLETNGFEVVGEADEALSAIEQLKNMEVDLALLDINLIGDKDGIWIAQKINEYVKIPFIYLTAYGDDNTIRRVVDSKPSAYLMKPFKEVDVISAIHIALNKHINQQQNFKSTNPNKPSTSDSLIIKENKSFIKLSFNEILFLKSDGNYIEIFTENTKYCIREKLSNLQEKLPEESFLRVHLRYLVSTDKINSYSNIQICIDNHTIPVSKSYSEGLSQKMNWK